MSEIRQKYASKISKKPTNTDIRTKGVFRNLSSIGEDTLNKGSGVVSSFNNNLVKDGDINEVEYMSNCYEKKVDSIKKKTMELPTNIKHISRRTNEKRHLSQVEKQEIATTKKKIQQASNVSVSKRMKIARRNKVASKKTGEAVVKGGKVVAKAVSKGVKVVGKAVVSSVKALAQAIGAFVSSVGFPIVIVGIVLLLIICCVVFVFSGGTESGILSDFIMPFEDIKNVRVTDEYGWRIHPITQNKAYHTGIDFGTAHHCNILAVADGEVVEASINFNQYGFGKSIKIKHSENLYTMYAHLSELKVVTGDIVKQGDIIGLEGGSPKSPEDYPTGASTGHHLHFEVYSLDRGVKVTTDPRDYLPKNDFHPDDIK